MHIRSHSTLAAIAALACMPVAAISHAGPGDIAGLGDGILPVTSGVDHMLADEAEQARDAFVAIWKRLRPALAGLDPRPLRLWAT